VDTFLTTLYVMVDDFCIWLNKQLGRPSLAFADLERYVVKKYDNHASSVT
jgi:hypothetical protein